MHPGGRRQAAFLYGHGRDTWRFRRLAIESLEDRRLLTSVTWVGGTTGYWDVASNWSGGAVPGSAADVTINPASPATVTIQAGDTESVSSVTLAASNALLMTGGSLTTAANLTNSGTITVHAGSALTVGGSCTNNAGATLSMPDNSVLPFAATNLLANDDFESPPIPTGSTTTSAASWTGTGNAYLTANYAYSGAQSLLVSSAASGVYQSVAATPGTSYALSVFATTAASSPLTGGMQAVIEIVFLDSTGKQLGASSETILTASSGPDGPLSGSVGNLQWYQFWTTAEKASGGQSSLLFL